MPSAIAVIVDIVRSRELADRAAAQRAVLDAFHTAEGVHGATVPLWSTVGDEFQAVYGDLGTAIAVTGLARLLLPSGVDVRVGIGAGQMRRVGDTTDGIYDGSAWWNARAAIDTAHRKQDGGRLSVSGWFQEDEPSARVATTNALLMLRDHVVGRMKARERRIAAAVLQGRRQADVARDEGITQSAVSQSLERSGASVLLEADRLLLGES